MLQVTKWAAYEKVSDGKNKLVDVAIGPACDECFDTGVEKLGYESFASYVAAKKKSTTVQRQADEVAQHRGTIPVATGASEGSVSHDRCLEVEVTIPFSGVRETDITSDLDVPRVAASECENVPKVQLPNMLNPAVNETWYLFDPSQPRPGAANINIKSSCKVSVTALSLPHGCSLFKEHADYELEKLAKKHNAEKGFAGMVQQSALVTYSDFKAKYGGAKRKRNQQSPSAKVTGRAAGMLGIQWATENTADDHGENEDLTECRAVQTPKKSRSSEHQGDDAATTVGGDVSESGLSDDEDNECTAGI